MGRTLDETLGPQAISVERLSSVGGSFFPLYPEGSLIDAGKPATLRLIWSGYYHPKHQRLWIGTEPGGLFESMEMVLASNLMNHCGIARPGKSRVCRAAFDSTDC
ncbi:MAG: hypothetical protein IPL46_17900 [Saprospiraceae bacterium]|nr:hypothetical protein [Saprospiraceae bacterium]MBK8503911.1 hypothetical protein [Saprospiraceae bacterium]